MSEVCKSFGFGPGTKPGVIEKEKGKCHARGEMMSQLTLNGLEYKDLENGQLAGP